MSDLPRRRGFNLDFSSMKDHTKERPLISYEELLVTYLKQLVFVSAHPKVIFEIRFDGRFH